MVHGGEALPLARQIESAQLMAAQGHGAVSPLHLGPGALEHGRQSFGLVMEWMLGLRAQHAHDAAGFKQRGAEPLGEFAKRFAIADGTRLGDAIEIIRGNQLGMHGKGDRRREIELLDLLTDLTRDELEGRLPLWHHPLGFLDTF